MIKLSSPGRRRPRRFDPNDPLLLPSLNELRSLTARACRIGSMQLRTREAIARLVGLEMAAMEADRSTPVHQMVAGSVATPTTDKKSSATMFHSNGDPHTSRY